MEIVLRALAVFLFLWLVTRAVGRSTLGELSTFELLLYVTMGDLVQQAVTQQDYSVTAAVLAVGTFAMLTTLLSWVQWKFPRSRPLIAGRPVMVIRDGKPVDEAIEHQRVSLADVLIAMREQGIRRPGDVEYAILEADGRLSFFPYEHKDQPAGAPEKPPEG
jgi:uncharacterized membrane protein YcaP (DUF421 family)